MFEIGKRKTGSGRIVEYQQVRWRRITKEEEKENVENFIKQKKQIQDTLTTPERVNLQKAVLVESRSPTLENKRSSPVNINKNYFTSSTQQEPNSNKWQQKSKQNNLKQMNEGLINKQQILNGIEGKIKRLTPSKSFNNSLLEPGVFHNRNVNYNSTQVFQKAIVTTNNNNLLQINRTGAHDAYGNFQSQQQKASYSPYRYPENSSKKSPLPLKIEENFNKENIGFEANNKLLRKPTLKNHLTMKDKDRNGIKHHEPSFVEDSNIFGREK